MHVRAICSLGISLLTLTFAAASAHAEEGYEAPQTPAPKRVFVGLSAGAAYAMVTHPLIKSNGFAAASLGIHVGFNVTERWALGLELSTFEHGMARTSGTDPFTPTQFLSPQGSCTNCKPPEPGGWISQTEATFTTIGPRVEFAPMGRDGLYLGLSGGLSMILGLNPTAEYGIGGGVRAGYRYRFANVLGLGLEAGLQAQRYDTASNFFPYASFVLRPYF